MAVNGRPKAQMNQPQTIHATTSTNNPKPLGVAIFRKSVGDAMPNYNTHEHMSCEATVVNIVPTPDRDLCQEDWRLHARETPVLRDRRDGNPLFRVCLILLHKVLVMQSMSSRWSGLLLNRGIVLVHQAR